MLGVPLKSVEFASRISAFIHLYSFHTFISEEVGSVGIKASLQFIMRLAWHLVLKMSETLKWRYVVL